MAMSDSTFGESASQYNTRDIHSRYLKIRDQIEATARKTGRPENSTRLVVVTKRQPIDTVRAAINAGIRDLGENYPEEAIEKIGQIGVVDGLNWHMIGHVQSRKANLIPGNFALVHSVDSLKLAAKIDRISQDSGLTTRILLEMNVGGEESKSGFTASDPSAWEKLLPEIQAIHALKSLEICGLMTMPPYFEEAEKSRPFFIRLRQLREYLQVNLSGLLLPELSMGTSADFNTAVEEGATIVRVGTAIMGPRL